MHFFSDQTLQKQQQFPFLKKTRLIIDTSKFFVMQVFRSIWYVNQPRIFVNCFRWICLLGWRMIIANLKTKCLNWDSRSRKQQDLLVITPFSKQCCAQEFTRLRSNKKVQFGEVFINSQGVKISTYSLLFLKGVCRVKIQFQIGTYVIDFNLLW